jgi:2-phosphosulfolactate phosphatase
MIRQVDVFLLPRDLEADNLRGGIAVVIDLLRASTTIIAALANGARFVVPCGEVADAKKIAVDLPAGTALLGGERGGVRIDGFDLDNSPAAYRRDIVSAKAIVLTTTNGTAALLRAKSADRILIGSLVNRAAVVREIIRDSRPSRLVCAGTEGLVTAEDLLCAGAMVAEIEKQCGGVESRDDLAMIARNFWLGQSESGKLLQTLRASRGGRNLVELGFDADIQFAASVDSIGLVAEYFPKTGRIEAVR